MTADKQDYRNMQGMAKNTFVSGLSCVYCFVNWMKKRDGTLSYTDETKFHWTFFKNLCSCGVLPADFRLSEKINFRVSSSLHAFILIRFRRIMCVTPLHWKTSLKGLCHENFDWRFFITVSASAPAYNIIIVLSCSDKSFRYSSLSVTGWCRLYQFNWW
jgi:hypothetical protein